MNKKSMSPHSSEAGGWILDQSGQDKIAIVQRYVISSIVEMMFMFAKEMLKLFVSDIYLQTLGMIT